MGSSSRSVRGHSAAGASGGRRYRRASLPDAVEGGPAVLVAVEAATCGAAARSVVHISSKAAAVLEARNRCAGGAVSSTPCVPGNRGFTCLTHGKHSEDQDTGGALPLPHCHKHMRRARTLLHSVWLTAARPASPFRRTSRGLPSSRSASGGSSGSVHSCAGRRTPAIALRLLRTLRNGARQAPLPLRSGLSAPASFMVISTSRSPKPSGMQGPGAAPSCSRGSPRLPERSCGVRRCPA